MTQKNVHHENFNNDNIFTLFVTKIELTKAMIFNYDSVKFEVCIFCVWLGKSSKFDENLQKNSKMLDFVSVVSTPKPYIFIFLGSL